MNIKNLNVRKNNIVRLLKENKAIKRTASIILTISMTASLAACGNRDMLDTNKNFDTAVLAAEDNNSALVLGVQQYLSYEGEQYQLKLDDGSVLLTSSYNAKLFNNKGEFSGEELAKGLVNYDAEITKISKGDKGSWNKTLFDTVHTFKKAIVLGANNATIYDIEQWTDYADDQIQIKLDDGTYVLLGIKDLILFKPGSEYKAEDISYGILGSDATIKKFDTEEGYKVLQKNQQN